MLALLAALLLDTSAAHAACTGPSPEAAAAWPEGRRMPPHERPRPLPGVAATLAVVPGLGHAYLCDWQGAAVGLGTPLGLYLGAGLIVSDERHGQPFTADDPLTIPLVYGIQNAWFYGIYDAWRVARLARLGGKDTGRLPVDGAAVSQHLGAPFRKESLRDPVVLGAAALGLVVSSASTISSGQVDSPVWRRETVFWAARPIPTAAGVALGEAAWTGVFVGVGPGEESLFRGVIQTTAVDALGPVAGITTASALFGMAHVDRDSSLMVNITRAAYTGALGLGLGWLAHHDGYDLRRPIAAHFWYDLGVGTAAFLLAPDQAPWAFQTQFSF